MKRAFTILAAVAAAVFSAAPGAAPDHPRVVLDLLEQEKLVTNIYRVYFPSLAVARKAAISFHAQMLESHYAAGYLVMQLNNEELDKLRPFGFRFEPAADFIQKRNQFLSQMQVQQSSRALTSSAAATVQSIPNYSCYETVEETFTQAQAFVSAKPQLASLVDAGDSWEKTQGLGGHDLQVLKLTNAAVTGDKPKLFINAAIHAREYTTAPLVLEFARWLVNGHGVNADAT